MPWASPITKLAGFPPELPVWPCEGIEWQSMSRQTPNRPVRRDQLDKRIVERLPARMDALFRLGERQLGAIDRLA